MLLKIDSLRISKQIWIAHKQRIYNVYVLVENTNVLILLTLIFNVIYKSQIFLQIEYMVNDINKSNACKHWSSFQLYIIQ